MELDLYGKELIAVDGSRFQAVNSKEKNYNHQKLRNRINRLEVKINQYFEEFDMIDQEENDKEVKVSKDKLIV